MKKSKSRLRYCLYARKSSESDDRQVASLDSQLNFMTQKAQKMGIEIVHVIQEAHSAKESGTREGLSELLNGITSGKWNGILTWSPDRLSRNAGDIGRIIDLMDRGRLQAIQTNDQRFANTPDDKFLLMILTSQAKLENDYRGKNVMRGMRAVCHTGKRPGPTPLGYKLWRDPENISAPSKIIINPDQSQHVVELFRLINEENYSTRQATKVVIANGFVTTKGNPVTLSTVIKILKDPFYYGEFEYPKGSGSWYKGTYEPIITKEVFDKAQRSLRASSKGDYRQSIEPVLRRCRCKKCGGEIMYKTDRVRCLHNCFAIQVKTAWKGIYAAIAKQSKSPEFKEKIAKERTRYVKLCQLAKQNTTISDEQIIEYYLQHGSRFDRYQFLRKEEKSIRI